MVKIPDALLAIPPLENGDTLTRDEFERRYNAMPHLKKAELIEGIVYMPAALRFKSHGQPHSYIIGWLVAYEAATPVVAVGVEPTVRLDATNEPQPDAVLLILPELSGQANLSDDDYIEGAPELVVEIAASSAAIDLHAKKQVYCRTGVKEYIVWQVLDQAVCWFYLENGVYRKLTPDSDGILRSRTFPGLWLAISDLLTGKMQHVLETLNQGIKSTEHAQWVSKIQQKPL